MKNILKNLAVLSAVVLLGTANVGAASQTKTINADACDTIYTNYYLLLEGNTQEYFQNANNAYNLVHENRGNYVNNVWRTDFDPDNVGYGVIDISTSTKVSSNKLSRWTLNEFYNYAALAKQSYNSNYIDGNNTFITSHSYQSKNSNGTWTDRGFGSSSSNVTINQYINATYDAKATIYNVSPISPNTSEFTIYIKRTAFSNYGSSRTPVERDGGNWLYNPQVFYVQYCSPKNVEKTINYNANAGSDTVTNMPSRQKFSTYRTTLSSRIPERNGYTFLGWSKNSYAGAKEDLYEAGASYTGDSTTLYAIWKKNSDPIVGVYRVSYIGNASGVTNIPNDEIRYLNENVQISNITPQLAGYTFLGWSKDATSTEADSKYAPNATITDRKDLTLYAVWKKNEATVTPTKNNPNNNYNNGGKQTVPENPATGVEDYLLPAGSVSLISVLGLTLLKKKSTFMKF